MFVVSESQEARGLQDVTAVEVAVLRQRLLARGKDTHEVVARRMSQVASQLEACSEYDYLIVNESLESSQQNFNAVFLSELSRRSRRQTFHTRVASSRRELLLAAGCTSSAP